MQNIIYSIVIFLLIDRSWHSPIFSMGYHNPIENKSAKILNNFMGILRIDANS